MEEPKKPHRPIRPKSSLLDKAQAHLAELHEAKVAEQASGRFGVVISFDGGKPTGVRQITDEPIM